MRPQAGVAAESASSAAAHAIADAKRDFEGIKSARDAALLPKGALPRISLPELKGPIPTPPVGTKTVAPAAESKTSNWLVDAMEKQDTARDTAGRDLRPGNRRSKSGSTGSVFSRDEGDTQKTDEGRGEREEGDRPKVINPLERYLDDWMTPQDYALLKPGLVESSLLTGSRGNSARFSTPEPAGSPGGLDRFTFGGLPSGSPVVLPQPRRDNPFLQSDKVPLSVTAPVGGSMTLARPPVPIPVAVSNGSAPPPPPAPAQTKIPEFAKPSTDEKYFKQLNRF